MGEASNGGRSDRAKARGPTRQGARHARSSSGDRPIAWHTDDRADPHYVVVALAIRGVGTCELSIAKDRYDPGKLLEIIDGAAKEASERG